MLPASDKAKTSAFTVGMTLTRHLVILRKLYDCIRMALLRAIDRHITSSISSEFRLGRRNTPPSLSPLSLRKLAEDPGAAGVN